MRNHKSKLVGDKNILSIRGQGLNWEDVSWFLMNQLENSSARPREGALIGSSVLAEVCSLSLILISRLLPLILQRCISESAHLLDQRETSWDVRFATRWRREVTFKLPPPPPPFIPFHPPPLQSFSRRYMDMTMCMYIRVG